MAGWVWFLLLRHAEQARDPSARGGMDRERRGSGPVAAANRRSGAERRLQHHLQTDWRFAWHGRRREVRRPEDGAWSGVDLYPTRLFILVLAICVLNALDAAFTLALVRSGAGEEANPLMRALLHRDEQLFVNIKIAITSASLLFLVVCSHVPVLRNVRVEHVLRWVVGVYGALMIYHIILLRAASIL